MQWKKTLVLATLIISGESIFILPFLISRVFRPTFLRVFEIDNLELGSAFSVYGLIAAVSYFFGGPLADRFSAKKLMAFSLFITAIGGIIMAFIPSLVTLTLLYGFWGLTSILLFWAAFIKTTRETGKKDTQGQQFGVVDAGRGLLAASLASISVFLFNFLLPNGVDLATTEELSSALSIIIGLFTLITFLSSFLIWTVIPEKEQNVRKESVVVSQNKFMNLIKQRKTWLHSMIILCAYVAYKCTDDFSLYASEVLKYNDVDAAHIGTISFWVRPLAALGLGLLGDRFLNSRMIMICFTIIIGGSLIIGLNLFNSGVSLPILLTIASISIGIYGLRGLYFALLEEGNTPLIYTGSTVGIISVIGYSPDIFMGPLMGYILDNSPGPTGHQQLFLLLTSFATIGLISTILFKALDKKKPTA